MQQMAEAEMMALGERHDNLADFADQHESEVNSSSFADTLSMLTEGIFRLEAGWDHQAGSVRALGYRCRQH
jgi:hypothetical protein